MSEYHKIQTIFKRDMNHPKKLLIEGDWTTDEFEYLANNEWEFTEKVDGTNIRVILSGDSVTFGGRTDAAQIPAKLFARLQELFTLERLREVFDPSVNVVLYGEGFGAGIQKVGGLYRQTQDFVLFDVRVGPRWYLWRHNVNDVAAKLGIQAVPVIGRGTLHDAVKWAKSGGGSRIAEDLSCPAEGIVARPSVEMCDRGGNRIIAKIKCRDFAGVAA